MHSDHNSKTTPDAMPVLTRRVLFGGAAISIGVAIMAAASESDELAWLIDEYREIQAYRNTLASCLYDIETDPSRPSVAVLYSEITPSIGTWYGNKKFACRYDADSFFSKGPESEPLDPNIKERWTLAQAHCASLFDQRYEARRQWELGLDYQLICEEDIHLFEKEQALLDRIVQRPCGTWAEAKLLANFAVSDIPEMEGYDDARHRVLRSIAGLVEVNEAG